MKEEVLVLERKIEIPFLMLKYALVGSTFIEISFLMICVSVIFIVRPKFLIIDGRILRECLQKKVLAPVVIVRTRARPEHCSMRVSQAE